MGPETFGQLMQAVQSAGQPAMDTSFAAWITMMGHAGIRRAWGGGRDQPAPEWLPVVALPVCAIIGVSVAAWIAHVNLLNDIGQLQTWIMAALGQAHVTDQHVVQSVPKPAPTPILAPVASPAAAAPNPQNQPGASDVLPPSPVAVAPAAPPAVPIVAPDASPVDRPATAAPPAPSPPAAPVAPISLPTAPVVAPVAPPAPEPAAPVQAAPVTPAAAVLLNADGLDIGPLMIQCAEAAGIPPALLMGGTKAESGLNPEAERWGLETRAAQAAISSGDTSALQAVIDRQWADISFGYSQRIVEYHELGDHSATAANCLAVRAAVFADPAADLLAMALRLAGSYGYVLSVEADLDLTPVGGDECLAALVIYNAGHYPPDPADAYWTAYAGNVASYRNDLVKGRATFGD